MQTLRRDNGDGFATLNNDGSRVFLVMRAPDGYSGREASWLLTLGEVKQLREALVKEETELTCRLEGAA